MNWIKSNFSIVKKNSLDKKKQKQFGGLVTVFLLAVYFVSVYKNGLVFNDKQIITLVSAIVLGGLVLLRPVIIFPFLFIWLFLGNILGEISSFIILGIVYYLLFTPISFFLKMKRKKNDHIGWLDKNGNIDYEKLY
ncbi:SxtJ family membrane protein [Aquimarina sp. M1]